MTVLFYRHSVSKIDCPTTDLPPGVSACIWRPSEHGIAGAGLARPHNIAWWVLDKFGAFANGAFAEISLWRDGAILHRLIVTPRWRRFPFMGCTDLQIGDVWTRPDCRGQGFASAAIGLAQRYADERGAEYLWYLVEASNTASIRLIEARGYRLLATGVRTRPLGIAALGRFRMKFNSPANSEGAFSMPESEAGRARKRFLMICMQFPTGLGQSYMTTELADALTAAGHAVEVLLLDWSAPASEETRSFVTKSGVRVVRCTPRSIVGLGGLIRNASKFILGGRQVARAASRHFDLSRFDAAIAWMPLVAIAPLVPLLRRAGIRHRLLFIWDFFPDHHREIGRIPDGLPYRVARAWEQTLLVRFTTIICTLPGNADYLRRNYRLDPAQRVLVTPLWSDTSPRPPVDRTRVRMFHDLPPDRPIAVFGGQLVAGRGFEQMLSAAATASAAGSSLMFLFVGDGPLAPMLRERAAAHANVLHRPALSRDAYLDLLSACDVGMVATAPGVTSFSTPTKTIDYLRAGLPVIAAVEHGNDFVAILERYRVGRAVPFGRAMQFQSEAERLATDPVLRSAARAGAPACLDEVFDVRHALSTVMDAVNQPPGAI